MFYFHNKCYEHYTLSYSFFHHMVAKEQFMYMLSSSPYHPLIKKKQSKTDSLPLSFSKKFNNENSLNVKHVTCKTHSRNAFIIKTARNKCLPANCTGPHFKRDTIQSLIAVCNWSAMTAFSKCSKCSMRPDVQAAYYWTHKMNLFTKGFINPILKNKGIPTLLP